MKDKLQRLVLPDEIAALIRYHDSAAKYQSDCHKTQTRIAKEKPLYTFGKHQTKADWLHTAAEWKRRATWHAARSAFWKRQNKILEAGMDKNMDDTSDLISDMVAVEDSGS